MSNLKHFVDTLKNRDFVVLDTETTGLNRGEIVQIAIVNSLGETAMNSLVKPALPIPADATRIHGITDEMVKDAATFPQLLPRIRQILEGRLVVVYNATYDRSMLHQSAERHNLDKTDWKEISTWLCAMEAFAEFYGEWNDYHGNYRWQRLSTAARYCGVPADNAHDALGDCLMTLGVTKHMLAKAESEPEQEDLSFERHDDATSHGCKMCGNEWKSLNKQGYCSSCWTVWNS